MDVKLLGQWSTIEDLPVENNWQVTMWTDGSCWPIDGPGGWAAYIELKAEEILPLACVRVWGRQANLCTTPKAEMNAIRDGLQAVPSHLHIKHLEIISDSQWAIRILTGEYTKKKYHTEWALIESLIDNDFPHHTLTHIRGHQIITPDMDDDTQWRITKNLECDAIAGWARLNTDISDEAFKRQEKLYGFK